MTLAAAGLMDKAGRRILLMVIFENIIHVFILKFTSLGFAGLAVILLALWLIILVFIVAGWLVQLSIVFCRGH